MKAILISDLRKSEKYHLLTSVVIPRPIAVVSTMSSNGTDNLAPFSYFNAVSSEPAIVQFTCARKRDANGVHIKKDTIRNLEQIPEMVIHISSVQHLNLVEQAGEDLPYGESEIQKLNLKTNPSTLVRPKRVTEFKVALECKVHQILPVGNCDVVFAEVLMAHADESVLAEGSNIVRAQFLNPLARLGQEGYAGIQIIPNSGD